MTKTVAFFCGLLLCGISAMAQNGPSEFDVHDAKVFSIGDIHGDLEALKNALQAAGLYSPQKEAWTGGKAHLVFAGDLIDRGPSSREVMDFVMSLEAKALAAGGRVHTLLGNHELMVTAGRFQYSHPNDLMAYRDFRRGPRENGMDGFRNAFRGDSKYAQWLRTRKTMIRINDTLFVHAGVENWALSHSMDEINSLVQSWLRHYQGIGERPPDDTKWVVSEGKGPLWTRVFVEFEERLKRPQASSAQTGMTSSDLNQILKKYGVHRVAVGHSDISNMEWTVNHPDFGSRVVLTDTGISVAFKKNVSFFEYSPSAGVKAFQVNRQFPKEIQIYTSGPVAQLNCRWAYQ